MRKEEEDQQMRQLVQTLQAALEKEKIKVKDLTEQVNTWCNSCKPFPVPLENSQRLWFVLLRACMWPVCLYSLLRWRRPSWRQPITAGITEQPCWNSARSRKICRPKRSSSKPCRKRLKHLRKCFLRITAASETHNTEVLSHFKRSSRGHELMVVSEHGERGKL